MHIHLLRVSSESETVRKFVMCIVGPLKSNRTNWHPHNLKFCTNFRNLLLYSTGFNSFNMFCHSLIQFTLENILKTKGMLYNAKLAKRQNTMIQSN